jgi:hypothetical protein
LSEASDNFLYAVNTFTNVRSGATRFYETPNGAMAVERFPHRVAYRVLEFLTGADQRGIESNPLAMVLLIAAGPKVAVPDRDIAYEWGPEIWDIVRRARLSRSRIKYQFISRLGRALLESFPSQCVIIPEDWDFPWGKREELRSFFQALLIRCFYHFVSIHFAASEASLPGLGYNQICLALNKEALVHDIVRISNLRSEIVCEILQALTLGEGEVVTKAGVCQNKVAQVKRKLLFARDEIDVLLGSFDLELGVSWTINAIVIVDGWSGVPSLIPNEIPIVPMEVFIALSEMVADLDRIHAILCCPLWLPRDGRDFNHFVEERDPWGVKLSAHLLAPGSRSFFKDALPEYVDELESKTSFELRAMPWL